MNMCKPQSFRYIDLQPTSIPSSYQQTAALPEAASSIARNATWPKKTIAFPVVPVPADGRIMNPVDAPQIIMEGQPK